MGRDQEGEEQGAPHPISTAASAYVPSDITPTFSPGRTTHIWPPIRHHMLPSFFSRRYNPSSARTNFPASLRPRRRPPRSATRPAPATRCPPSPPATSPSVHRERSRVPGIRRTLARSLHQPFALGSVLTGDGKRPRSLPLRVVVIRCERENGLSVPEMSNSGRHRSSITAWPFDLAAHSRISDGSRAPRTPPPPPAVVSDFAQGHSIRPQRR